MKTSEVDLMAEYALKTWLSAGHSLDELRVVVDKRLEDGDHSAEKLALAIAAHERRQAASVVERAGL